MGATRKQFPNKNDAGHTSQQRLFYPSQPGRISWSNKSKLQHNLAHIHQDLVIAHGPGVRSPSDVKALQATGLPGPITLGATAVVRVGGLTKTRLARSDSGVGTARYLHPCLVMLLLRYTYGRGAAAIIIRAGVHKLRKSCSDPPGYRYSASCVGCLILGRPPSL